MKYLVHVLNKYTDTYRIGVTEDEIIAKRLAVQIISESTYPDFEIASNIAAEMQTYLEANEYDYAIEVALKNGFTINIINISDEIYKVVYKSDEELF